MNDFEPMRVYSCGCIESVRDTGTPEGVEVMDGEVEWHEFQVQPCGNRESCQHPIAVADRAGAFE